jgi:hypothetical protein
VGLQQRPIAADEREMSKKKKKGGGKRAKFVESSPPFKWNAVKCLADESGDDQAVYAPLTVMAMTNFATSLLFHKKRRRRRRPDGRVILQSVPHDRTVKMKNVEASFVCTVVSPESQNESQNGCFTREITQVLRFRNTCCRCWHGRIS